MTARPNIVLILTDQLRYDVIGANGSQVCRTPALDRLASEGLRFTRAYTPSAICSPARTSLLTGVYPHAHGVLNNVTGPDAVAADVRQDQPLLPRLLAEVGYRTGYLGKYHVAAHEDPTRHGFADAGAPWMFWDDADFLSWRRERGHPPEDPSFIPIDRRTATGVPVMGLETVPADVTLPAYHVDRATRLLDRYLAGDEPFFLVLSFLGPHWPHMVPEPFWSMYDAASLPPWPNFGDDYAGKPAAQVKALAQHGVADWTWEDWAPVVATYLASVTFHDMLIGRFLDALAERGAADDTLVAVTTDHGDMTGSHRQFNKGTCAYEETYHIPLFLRWPGRIGAGAVSDAFTSLVDLMPTFLRAAGLDVPNGLHGHDLLALDAAGRDSAYAQFHGNEFGLVSQRMVRDERHKYVYNAHDIDELYDLHADPHELVNLAADPGHAAQLQGMQGLLLRWMERTGDPLLPASRAMLSG